MKVRLKTKSKHFYDDEILGVLTDGSIVLKPGVRRQPKYKFSTDSEDNESLFNNSVYYRDRIERIKKIKEEDDDWG